MARRDRLYDAWKNMRQRCNNPNRPDYHRYGGRGITVCPEWESFQQFAEDMGKPPEGLTLDRIDNEKGYSKENCRWASREVQARNQSLYTKAIKTSKTGILGVSFPPSRPEWHAYGGTEFLYRGHDLFEAVCRRKSWENKQRLKKEGKDD